jgi:hypothetical protein
MKHPYARLISMSTVLALLLAVVATTIAQADDPPPPAATEETVVSPPEEETPPAPVLEILPENTTLVVMVDEQVVPLGSTAATNAILVGDPIWCPEGVAPTPSANGCTASYPTLESLIDDFDTSALPEPDQHGTIWIMTGTDTSTMDLVIDGAVFTTWSNFRLTLQGGWDGTSAGTLVGSSSFSVPISIYNWNNQVTVSNITVQDANATGLVVESTGDIVLENVTASDNLGYGAELYADGDITLNGFNIFNGNAASGVYAEAGGNITANNVTADGNDGAGTELYASGDVNLTGNNSFSDNADAGLYAEAGGDLQAENLTASNNNSTGAELLASNNIILSGVNTFNTNIGSGLIVDAGGDVSLNNIEASDNGSYGAEVYAPGNVTLDGNNLFDNNAFGGLLLDAGGNIFIGNLSAHENGGYGAELYTPGNVSIGNASANDNDYSGLYIEAGGDIALENITASGNGRGGAYGSGIEAYTLGRFNLTGLNSLNDNYFEGLYVDAIGNIFILNVFAEANGTSGVYLESAGNARIECSTFANNTGPEIEADLSGILTLAGVDFGGDLDNEVAVDDNHLVLVSNACFTYPVDNDDDKPASPLPNTDAITLLPIHHVTGSQPVELDCDLYQGTLITLENGDGAYIPCPIEDTAQLADLADVTLPGEIPAPYSYVSGFLLAILKDGQSLGPLNHPNAIWYASTDQIRNSTVQAFYWNGADWIELTDQITPFMRLFFDIPAELKGAELAILYWDGTDWVEVTGPAHLGNGYLIREGGHVSPDGSLFEATLNFTGTFVLVKK